VTAITPTIPGASGLPDPQVPVDAAGAAPTSGTPPATGATPTSGMPPATGAAGAAGTPGTGAPVLPPPLTGLPKDLDIEALIKLISEESRKETINSTIESIKGKGQRKLDNLKNQLEQIKKQIEANSKNEPVSLAKKIFGWIGAVVGVIVAVAAVVATAGAATPLLVGACILAGVAIASLSMQIAQEATAGSDKPYFPGQLFSKLLQACGVDEKTANIAGAAVVGGLMLVGAIAGTVLTLGAGSAGAISTISNVAKTIKTVAAVVQCATTLVNGALTITNSMLQYESDKAGVSLKEIKALLEKLREMTKQEEDFLKALMEEEKMITEAVKKIVDGAQETARVVLSGEGAAPAPSMA
jgi:hypothetical protein